MKRHAKILEPLDFGFVKLRNRVVMGSMHTGLEMASHAGKKSASSSMIAPPSPVFDTTSAAPPQHHTYDRLARFYRERAKGKVGLIITGGYSPSTDGLLYPGESVIQQSDVDALRCVTDAVHEEGGCIALQMLHPGRYANGENCVAPSPLPSPLSRMRRAPTEMSVGVIRKTVEDFAKLALNAKAAGFDGVEIMGSEGYLLNQFVARHTNQRTDDYGGSFENRIRFPLEVLRGVRAAVGPHFLVIFRVSLLDLVPDGSTHEEVCRLAVEVARNGADILNSGIGWHEARIPTIATSVPRAGYTWATRAVRQHLRSQGIETPLIAVNRMNHPDVLEQVLENGDADMVAMARPFLSDPYFVEKTMRGMSDRINVCIGCNEACLDHIFQGQVATCMLNPITSYEEERAAHPTSTPKKIAVIGGGPAGASTAITMANRGHKVDLFEQASTLGGQFNLAKRIPGKEEFQSSINYWTNTIQQHPNITLHLNTTATPEMIGGAAGGLYDEVVIATGCEPRKRTADVFDGADCHSNVFSYTEALLHPERVGKRVVILGAGGIGFDMAEFLTSSHSASAAAVEAAQLNQFEKQETEEFTKKWGIEQPGKTESSHPGNLVRPSISPPYREVTLLQRSRGKLGAHLGATTGWIHRIELRMNRVHEVSGVTYKSFDGKRFLYVDEAGEEKVVEVDSVVLCTGQESNKHFEEAAKVSGVLSSSKLHTIGGCNFTKRLDAKLAILQGHSLAISI